MSLLTSFITISQEVPDGIKESQGGPWQFLGLLPLFDPPRHDSAETIRRALNLGVNVKMITGICPLQCIIYSKAESNTLMSLLMALHLFILNSNIDKCNGIGVNLAVGYVIDVKKVQ